MGWRKVSTLKFASWAEGLDKACELGVDDHRLVGVDNHL